VARGNECQSSGPAVARRQQDLSTCPVACPTDTSWAGPVERKSSSPLRACIANLVGPIQLAPGPGDAEPRRAWVASGTLSGSDSGHFDTALVANQPLSPWPSESEPPIYSPFRLEPFQMYGRCEILEGPLGDSGQGNP
jgi:hypothetical protein